jgi:hypothetical protein
MDNEVKPMNKVATINASVKNITAPSELRQLNAWLVWRFEDSGRDKPNKVPYYIDGSKRAGEQGAESDRRRLATFDAARSYAASKGFDGIGFALMPEFEITALDFDDCVTGEGVDPMVQSLVAGTYAEYSPSGEGIRAFVRGKLPDRKTQEPPFGFETFSNKGYVTVTGNITEATEILGLDDVVAPMSDEIYTYFQTRFGAANDDDFTSPKEPIGVTLEQFESGLAKLDPSMGYWDWLKIGMSMHYELNGSKEAFDVWDEWSSTSAKYKGTAKTYRHWRSFGGNGGNVVTGAYFVRLANNAGAQLVISTVATAEDFEDLVSKVEQSDTAHQTFRFQPIDAHAFSQGEPPRWLMKRIIPESAIGTLIGQPGTGKSFMAMDMAFAIAQGHEWRGHKVKQGRVVIIAAEGAGGMRKRLQAYAQYHDIDLANVPLQVIPAAPNLVETKEVAQLVAAIKHGGEVALVIVDTFAQTTPGSNENSGEDVGKALANCALLHKHTGAFVLLVHHVGKDESRGARGWSGLKGNVDLEMHVQRKNGDRHLQITKQKDGEDGQKFGFALEVQSVGVDEDGDVIDSCVVVEAELAQESGPRKKRGKNEVKAMAVLADHVPVDGTGVSLDYLAEQLKDELDRGNGQRDNRKAVAKKTLTKLLEEDEHLLYALDGEFVKQLV